MSKKELIRRALESTKKQLIDYLDGMPAILLSELEPFELFSLLKENQSAASAKAGQIAPKDILVNAGPTQLVPGPIVSQLGAAGIKSGIVNWPLYLGLLFVKYTPSIPVQSSQVPIKSIIELSTSMSPAKKLAITIGEVNVPV